MAGGSGLGAGSPPSALSTGSLPVFGSNSGSSGSGSIMAADAYPGDVSKPASPAGGGLPLPGANGTWNPMPQFAGRPGASYTGMNQFMRANNGAPAWAGVNRPQFNPNQYANGAYAANRPPMSFAAQNTYQQYLDKLNAQKSASAPQAAQQLSEIEKLRAEVDALRGVRDNSWGSGN